MDILFNDSGTPLMMSSALFYGQTSGTPSANELKKRDILCPFDTNTVSTTPFGNYKVMNWGNNNEFPQTAAKTIRTTSVLNTG